MHALTRWFIKTSFVYLILSLIMGVIIEAHSLGISTFLSANLFPTYLHLFVEGWITMLIIGVAIWMFPKFTIERPRGNEALGWSSYFLLNSGLLLRLIGEPTIGLTGTTSALWAIAVTLAAILQWLGGMAFVINTWGRVKVK